MIDDVDGGRKYIFSSILATYSSLLLYIDTSFAACFVLILPLDGANDNFEY